MTFHGIRERTQEVDHEALLTPFVSQLLREELRQIRNDRGNMDCTAFLLPANRSSIHCDELLIAIGVSRCCAGDIVG